MILVTGGAGFIGRHLCASLRTSGFDVRAVDDLSSSPWPSSTDDVEVRDVLDLTPADLQDVDSIVHLAARKSVPESFVDRSLMSTNIAVDRHLLELVCEHPVRRLVLASSCEVYGGGVGPLAEHLPLQPRSPYAVGKATTELLAQALSTLTPTEISCARLFNTFGPGEGLDAVVPRFVHDSLTTGRLYIDGDGRQCRYFSDVAPVVSLLQRLVSAPVVVPVVNVAAGEELSILELALMIRGIVGDVDVVHGPGRRNEISRFVPDLTMLADVVGPIHRSSFKDALAACVDFERSRRRPHGAVAVAVGP